MKYLVLLLIVVVGVWWIRQQRHSQQSADKQSGTQTQVMVACSACGTHVPANDAVRGAQGVYCCKAHRDNHEA